jgi:vancomycin resistance protein YoaR
VGRELKLEATLIYLTAQLQTFSDGEVPLVVQEIQPQILDVSAQADAARQILSQPLTLAIPNVAPGDAGPVCLQPGSSLANLLTVQSPKWRPDGCAGSSEPQRLRDLLVLAKSNVDRLPADAKFIFNDSTRQLDLMEESRVGRTLDVDASIKAINEAIGRGEHTASLVVNEAQPRVAATATGQELGITELVHEETSYFYGSSAERMQNIEAASKQYHGLLVAPGETFSMGEHLGDVSLDNGFAEALHHLWRQNDQGRGWRSLPGEHYSLPAVFNAGFLIGTNTSRLSSLLL